MNMLVLHLLLCLHHTTATSCINRRPTATSRRFVSSSIDAQIKSIAAKLVQQNNSLLACVFTNTLPNTLDTTVLLAATTPNDTSFVITGDINAMWLRDSMNQVLPYMTFAKDDVPLRTMLAGLVTRQAEQIIADPYANAHNLPDVAGASPNINDQTSYPGFGPSRSAAMVPGIYERKYELDSLCSFLKLSRSYYESTSSKSWLPGWASEAEKYVLLSKGTSLLFGGPSLWGSIIKVS